MTASSSNTTIFVETTDAATSVEDRSAAAPRRCRPFALSVMVYNPQAGYKFEIEIEKSCTETRCSSF